MEARDSAYRSEPWRRHALLGISLAMVATGLLLDSILNQSADTEFVRGLLLKVGVVLFMLWLALPQLRKLNPWTAIPVAALCLTAIVRPQLMMLLPRIILPLAPVLFLIWLFWKAKKKS